MDDNIYLNLSHSKNCETINRNSYEKHNKEMQNDMLTEIFDSGEEFGIYSLSYLRFNNKSNKFDRDREKKIQLKKPIEIKSRFKREADCLSYEISGKNRGKKNIDKNDFCIEKENYNNYNYPNNSFKRGKSNEIMIPLRKSSHIYNDRNKFSNYYPSNKKAYQENRKWDCGNFKGLAFKTEDNRVSTYFTNKNRCKKPRVKYSEEISYDIKKPISSDEIQKYDFYYYSIIISTINQCKSFTSEEFYLKLKIMCDNRFLNGDIPIFISIVSVCGIEILLPEDIYEILEILGYQTRYIFKLGYINGLLKIIVEKKYMEQLCKKLNLLPKVSVEID
ncbi:hypothetical protein AYI68_g6847 [Smittium mucronatum]|uniref:Uncharacterized protein n=1 Tax=Smittium mucronatum TaxID=133383 RepID=A0A1R0GQC4_9FUNG|nr:hypothetical protein AYI68_g6847 [Smittium mucronatum]